MLPSYPSTLKLTDIENQYAGERTGFSVSLSEFYGGGDVFRRVSRSVSIFNTVVKNQSRFTHVARAGYVNNQAYAVGIRDGFIIVMRFDVETGQENWFKQLSNTATSVVGVNIISNNSALGYFDCIIAANNSTGGLIIRVRGDGQVVWSKQLTTPLVGCGRWSGVAGTDSQYTEFIWNRTSEVQYYWTGGALLKFSNETLLWARNIPGGTGDIVSGSVSAYTGDVFLIRPNTSSNVLVQKVNSSDGAIGWSMRLIENSSAPIVPKDVSVTKTGEGVAIVSNLTNSNSIAVSMMGVDGSVVWNRVITPTSCTISASTIDTSFDNGFIIGGTFVSGGLTKGFLFRLDRNGIGLWAHSCHASVGTSSSDTISKVLVHDGSRILIINTSIASTTNEYSSVIVGDAAHLADGRRTEISTSLPAITFEDVGLSAESTVRTIVTGLTLGVGTLSLTSTVNSPTITAVTRTLSDPTDFRLIKSSGSIETHEGIWYKISTSDLSFGDFHQRGLNSNWTTYTPDSTYRYVTKAVAPHSSSRTTQVSLVNLYNRTTFDNEQTQLIRTDAGSPVILKNPQYPSDYSYNDMVKSAFYPGYLIVGRSGNSGFVGKVNENRQSKWSRTLTSADGSGISFNSVCNGGGANSFYVGGTNLKTPIILRYLDNDTSASLQWQKTITGLTGNVVKVINDTDSNAVFALIEQTRGGLDTRFHLVKLNSLGNYVWRQQLEVSTVQGAVSDMFIDKDTINVVIFSYTFKIKKSTGDVINSQSLIFSTLVGLGNSDLEYQNLIITGCAIDQEGGASLIFSSNSPIDSSNNAIVYKYRPTNPSSLREQAFAIKNAYANTISVTNSNQIVSHSYVSFQKGLYGTIPITNTRYQFFRDISWDIGTLGKLSAAGNFTAGAATIAVLYSSETTSNTSYTDNIYSFVWVDSVSSYIPATKSSAGVI